jgi:phosphatidylinositol-bisphosphatase
MNILPLKKGDFGLKIRSELQFDLMFKENDEVYCLEGTSVGTMWSIMSALTNAQKEINKGEASDIMSSFEWIQFYIEKYSSKSSEQKTASSLDDMLLNSSDSEFNTNTRSEPEKLVVTSSSLKDDWIKTQLKAREDEFTEVKNLKVVIGTWNVNSKIPNASLAGWLRIHEEADIYVMGLQEIDMTAGALLREETEQGLAWSHKFDETFSQAKSNYIQIMARQLVGIYHCIYIHEKHRNFISDVRSASEGVGVLGMMGNKGGVGIRFKLYETTFCFINAHLAPHMDAIARRNQNYNDIVRRTNFNGGAKYAPEKHDYFFWLGDLNYRINLPDAEVRECIRTKDFKRLLEFDQLHIEHKAGRVLNGMVEGKITFQPTYKFDAGTNLYDTSEKKRIPSYTDRIFWMETPNIKQDHYSICADYVASDHKPVVASFTVGAKIVQQERYNRCYRELIKTLDRLENDMLPEIRLSCTGFVYDDVKYDVPVARTLELENTGQVVCEYQFVPKPSEEEVSRRWLQIDPLAGIIIPGEKAEIKFTLCVDSRTAADLTFDKDTIDDILILHLKNGRDHFISMSGSYIRSCFGNSLENLVISATPVRSDSKHTIESPHKVPHELWRMVDYIYARGMSNEGVFKESGFPQEKQTIRERLDTGEPFDAGIENSDTAVHSFGEVLLSFLEALAEPVVPSKFYRMCIEACASSQACVHIISKIPAVHFNTFHYIMAFLREFIRYKESNLVEPDELAIIFSRVLLRPPRNYSTKQAHSLSDQKAKALFIKHFLDPSITWTQRDLIEENTNSSVGVGDQ